MPFFDTSELHLPQLKNLRLGHFTFAYQEQVDWITRHTTLQSLRIDSCPILSLLYVYQPETGAQRLALRSVKAGVLQKTGKDEFGAWYRSPLLWDQVFDVLASNLPVLKTFEMDGVILSEVSFLQSS